MPVSSAARTDPGATSHRRSNAWAWRRAVQPASCAVWTALDSKPAATSTSTKPVNRKNRDEVDAHSSLVDREPQADGDRDTQDRSGSRSGRVGGVPEHGQEEDRGLEPFPHYREEGHADDRPADPSTRADSALRSSDPFSSREWRFIHTTM